MDGVGVITANKVIHQSRFESQHWIFLRTSGTKLGVDLGTFPSRLGCNRDSYLLLKSIRVCGNCNRFLAALKHTFWEPPTPTVRVTFEELNCPLNSCSPKSVAVVIII